MPSIDQEVSDLKTRIEAATRQKIRAEHDQETARQAADSALERLKAEYGVSTVDEAKALMLSMQEELTSLISQTRQSLGEINL